MNETLVSHIEQIALLWLIISRAGWNRTVACGPLFGVIDPKYIIISTNNNRYVYMYIYIYTRIDTYLHIIYVYTHVHICIICIIYISIIHIHIHIHIHIIWTIYCRFRYPWNIMHHLCAYIALLPQGIFKGQSCGVPGILLVLRRGQSCLARYHIIWWLRYPISRQPWWWLNIETTSALNAQMIATKGSSYL